MTDTLWLLGFVGVASTGLVVLTWAALRLARAVDGLGRELERTRSRLEPEQTALAAELRTFRRRADPA